MEMEKDDESQFGVIKDATKSLKWFLDNAENPNYDNDPDFDYSVSRIFQEFSLII